MSLTKIFKKWHIWSAFIFYFTFVRHVRALRSWESIISSKEMNKKWKTSKLNCNELWTDFDIRKQHLMNGITNLSLGANFGNGRTDANTKTIMVPQQTNEFCSCCSRFHCCIWMYILSLFKTKKIGFEKRKNMLTFLAFCHIKCVLFFGFIARFDIELCVCI